MGKAVMFMAFVWLIVTIGGGVAQGSVISSTPLTVAISDTDTTITVVSTDGFLNTGFITILDERIGYSSKTDTTFKGSATSPLVRGLSGTTATAHSAGEVARTIESALINQAIGYKLAVITDASGLLAFITIPLALLSMLGTIFTLPLGFLGTDLEFLTYLWGVLTIGMILSLGLAIVGGRRV